MTEALPLPVHRMGDTSPLSPIGCDGLVANNAARHAGNAHCSLTPPMSLSTRRRDEPPAGAKTTVEDGDANDGKPEQLRVDTANTASPDESRDFLCICTPAPKIPRPRNAFILYRQHHQAQVTTQNPKLSNPDISKIIGLQWKSERSEVKENWKKLAEEEKQRHQKQYPEYRYQPRRSSKGLTNRSGPSPTEDHERCIKCNGRLMTTPQTPPTPIDTPISRHTGSEIESPASYRALELQHTRKKSMDGVLSKKFPLAISGRKNRSPSDFEPLSPENKRRRANGLGGYHQPSGILGPYGHRTSRDGGRIFSEGTPLYTGRQYVGSPLAEFGPLPRSWSGPMAPPPRPSPSAPWSEQRRLAILGTYDESLRLPPLQTPVSPSPMRMGMSSPHPEMATAGLGISVPAAPPTRSLESAIMSLPFRRKLGLLARICRPVPPVAEAGTRGAFIAVEGPDEGLLLEVGDAVEKGLAAMDDVRLQIWSSDHEAPGVYEGDEGSGNHKESRFVSCFQTILRWQEKSSEIVRHITRAQQQPGKSLQGTCDELKSPPSSNGSQSRSPTEKGETPCPGGHTPVALAKHGFSLTCSDRFACQIPITDSYTPADHWQWVASLWRGIVCPDLVVYAKPSSVEELNKFGPVDFSRRMGMILVRIDPERGLDEGMERRIAFEVMEWMREASFREELPKHWRTE